MNLKKYIILTMALSLNVFVGFSSFGNGNGNGTESNPMDLETLLNNVLAERPDHPNLNSILETMYYKCQKVTFTLTPEGEATFIEHSTDEAVKIDYHAFKKTYSEVEGTLVIPNQEEGGKIYVTNETLNSVGTGTGQVIQEPVVIPVAQHCFLEVDLLKNKKYYKKMWNGEMLKQFRSLSK